MADHEDTLLDEILAFSLAYKDLSLHGSFPSAAAASSSSSSSSSSPFITCDLCGASTSLDNSYLDMHGCAHVLCLQCLHSSSAPDCPVPSCRAGSIVPPSRTPSPSPCDIECPICMEPKSPSEAFFDVAGCDHVFCSDCVARYVAARVEENSVEIPCPSCSEGSLQPEACRGILPHEVFARWGAALCESSIEGSARFYCPYRDCSALLVKEEGVEAAEAVDCPHCRRSLCVACKVPWHEGVSCEEFQRLGDGDRGKEDLMLINMAKESRWQRCPECGIFVERVDGCVFIKCRCKYCFCYLCAAKMDDNDLKHYCSKCKCTWDDRKKAS